MAMIMVIQSISNDYCEEFELIKKELKALEIIKTKNVDISMFYEIVSTVDKMFAHDRYNQETNEEILTQEEFDLLKEVLENEQ